MLEILQGRAVAPYFYFQEVKEMKKSIVFRLVISGAMLALAFVLSFVKIPFLPYGGSISLFSMVPIVFIGCLYGPSWGLIVGFLYSLLQLFQSAVVSQAFVGQNAKYVVLMLLFDFIVAFTVLGLGGMFITKKNITSKAAPFLAAAGGAIVCIARYISHTVSGYLLFAEYAEWFFTQDGVKEAFGDAIMQNFSGSALSWIYSAIYNATYMIPETVLTAVGIFAVMMVLKGIKRTEKLMVEERNSSFFRKAA